MGTPSAFREHDHAACTADALARAEAICRERGTRLTPQRRHVLELIWAAHRPVGAYDLLDTLQREGTRAAPPTVYRALDFLQEQGLIHRVEGLNAFIGCTCPETPHGAQLLICRNCRSVAEFSDEGVDDAIDRLSRDQAFQPENRTVEIHGLCPSCRDPQP